MDPSATEDTQRAKKIEMSIVLCPVGRPVRAHDWEQCEHTRSRKSSSSRRLTNKTEN